MKFQHFLECIVRNQGRIDHLLISDNNFLLPPIESFFVFYLLLPHWIFFVFTRHARDLIIWPIIFRDWTWHNLGYLFSKLNWVLQFLFSRVSTRFCFVFNSQISYLNQFFFCNNTSNDEDLSPTLTENNILEVGKKISLTLSYCKLPIEIV